MRTRRERIVAVSLLLFFFGMTLIAIPTWTMSHYQTGVDDTALLDVGFNRSEVRNNETLTQGLLSFIDRSQDNGAQKIPSMDMAFYIGMSSFFLDNLSYTHPTSLFESCLEFIQSARNDDGGYGNWDGAKSSVESTYQALRLLSVRDNIGSLTLDEANATLRFMNDLRTLEEGYLPLPLWDAPDVSSTYRASYIFDLLKKEFPSLPITLDNSSLSFIDSAYVPPIFAVGASGFSENVGGSAELLASLYALRTYVLFNVTDSPYFEPMAKFLDSLVATNGGVAGRPGGFPTTGFTTAGIEMYLLFKTRTVLDIDSFVSPSFIEKAVNYLLANRAAGSGFTASDRDTTPEYSSTFFTLRSLVLLKANGYLPTIPDLSGVVTFLLDGIQPSFGFGEYPGDSPDLATTAYALLISRYLNDSSVIDPGVSQYIKDSYSQSKGGFGFRPGSTPRVKYTYYGIRALRSFGDPVANVREIEQFILDSQNPEGGFGERPGSSLSYLTHTYWAVSSLKMLTGLDGSPLDAESILNWLFYLRKPDGTYSNFVGQNGTLRSTYRALQVLYMLGGSLSEDDALRSTLALLQTPSGGFLPSFDKTVPTMESTFYGTAISLLISEPINPVQIRDFVFSLLNKDGGFGLRPGFSSRIRSSFYGLLTLLLLERNETVLDVLDISEDPFDVYSPIIYPAFVPKIDNNKAFHGSYQLTATILEPETDFVRTWVEAKWTDRSTNETTEFTFEGEKNGVYQNEWSYLMGTFNQAGVLQFRILAVDDNQNSVSTEWYFLQSIEAVEGNAAPAEDIISAAMPWITPFFFGVAAVEGVVSYGRKRNEKESEILMSISEKDNDGIMNSDTLSVIGILIIMGTISFLARLFLQDTILIAANSIFLFRFLLGMMVVLVVKYVIGIKTFGLFGPTVIVVSMIALGPLWGLAVFLNIFAVGYMLRSLLSQFNLAVGFRIGILMILTISMIGLMELLGEVFLIPVLSGSILLPIIITPWYIDRFVTEMQQSDHLAALSRFVVTLGVSLVAYIFMSMDALVTFIVVNPEIWVLLTGAVLYFGRSSRYTKMDMQRFRRLFAKHEEPLSMQIRNRDYIAKYNSHILYPLINKYDMKEQFEKWRVPSAELLALVNDEERLSALMIRLKTEEQFRKGFVIKPARSYGGKGIIVVEGRTAEGNFVIGGEIYAPIAIETEIRKILQGEYLTSQTLGDKDIVIIEERIINHPKLAKISFGLPDVRVIVFRGIPVMAMMRLATKESQGKANLKQGAIGAAVRLSDGVIYRAEIKGTEVERHPDTGERIIGFAFENWQEILAIACLAQKSSGLGYAGVDIVIDENDRVLLLEINKRPGLEIQNVNQHSLLQRLELIEERDLDATERSPISAAQLGIQLAMDYWEKEAV